MGRNNEFFDQQSGASGKKTNIVMKYFDGYSKVMLGKVQAGAVGYIDFFSGPGVYEDGKKSTAIKILEYAVTNEKLNPKFLAWYNDKNKKFVKKLKDNIANVDGIQNLARPPLVTNKPMDETLVELFKKRREFPCFIFIDPWGYKGITLDLILSSIESWGCDVLLFFSYNRINAAITNPKVPGHIEALFGVDKANDLRSKVPFLKPGQRELLVMKTFREAIQEHHSVFEVSFKIKSAKGQTSHFLVFLSKNVLGYSIMKSVMHGESQIVIDGVANYCFDPRLRQDYQPPVPLISPLYELEQILEEQFVGQKLTMRQVYERHHVGTPYVEKNYKTALLTLEAKGKIIADPPVEKRNLYKGKKTFGDKVIVQFSRS